MSLIEHDLYRGRIDKVQMAIERLKAFEPQEGYYLAYSGGKDSDCILALAKMSGVKFDLISIFQTLTQQKWFCMSKNIQKLLLKEQKKKCGS